MLVMLGIFVANAEILSKINILYIPSRFIQISQYDTNILKGVPDFI